MKQQDLGDAAKAPYIPARPAKRSYVPQVCVMDGCEVLLPSYSQHTGHLRGPHHLSKEEAPQIVEDRAQFEMIIPQPVVGKKRAPTAKSTKEALETSAPPQKKTRAFSRTPATD